MGPWVIVIGVVLLGLVPMHAEANCEVQTGTATYTEGTNLGGDVCGTTGGRKVELSTKVAGEDKLTDVLKVEQRYSYVNITTATNTEVHNESGRLHAVIVNTAVANGVIAIYDGLNSTTCSGGGGSLIGTITMPATLLQNHFVIPYNASFGTGLCVTTTGTPNVTVMYQ